MLTEARRESEAKAGGAAPPCSSARTTVLPSPPSPLPPDKQVGQCRPRLDLDPIAQHVHVYTCSIHVHVHRGIFVCLLARFICACASCSFCVFHFCVHGVLTKPI